MNYADYLKFLFALIFVLSLMGGLAYVLKRFGLTQNGISPMGSKSKKRLRIVEILPLDGKRKAVLIQRDLTQHLVLLSSTGETVVETNIKAPKELTDETKH